MKRSSFAATAVYLLFLYPAVLFGQGIASLPGTDDPARVGRFDYGKMWTFENPPLEYFSRTYDFSPDAAWFERARLAALRIPGCSAGFVSPNGLIATNHHCARGSVARVSREGENLLDNGFYARTMAEERPIEGYYADQLVAIEDVTARVQEAVDRETSPEARQAARTQAMREVEREIAGRPHSDSVVVQVVSLYNGGRYSAYTFRRYTDLRLVMAPELQLGFFGADEDNFTYPRYALDFSLLRAYDRAGNPVRSEHYFPLAENGVEEREVVFVVGNPGSTARQETVAQLEHRRDVSGPITLRFLTSRIAALQRYQSEAAERGEPVDVRNQIFGLSNSIKAFTGRQAALTDTVIMMRRADGERHFLNAVRSSPVLYARYAGVLEDMASVQTEKTRLADELGAFLQLTNPGFTPGVLLRAFYALQILEARRSGAPAARIEELTAAFRAIRNQPPYLERRFLELRLADVQRHLAPVDAEISRVLGGKTPEQAAADILSRSVLAEPEPALAALESGALGADDPAAALIRALLPRYAAFQAAMADLTAREQDIAERIGRARYEVYGTSIPPDATFSLRIADGVVLPYTYNGTVAPPYTTFYGLYDHYYSYGPDSFWNLPARWLDPPASFDKSTPLNFISTSDTIGGNSGSPVVNRRLELVGLNFDRNIEGLSRDFIYLPERGRNMAADSRAIIESLDDIYDADRLVVELTSGRLIPSEDQAPE